MSSTPGPSAGRSLEALSPHTPQLISLPDWQELRTRLESGAALPAAGGRPTLAALPQDAPSAEWSFGMPSTWLAELLQDWSGLDLAGVQARVDALEHRFLEVGGQALHVCLAPGQGERPRPLLLTNGWPSSFLEYLELIPLLTRASDGDPAGHDCFSLVIPALPGYGFSAPPSGVPLTGRAVAGHWNELMTEVLGHRRYVAHGTDLGAGITAWLARDHSDSVDGIHLGSPHLPPAREPNRAEERAFNAALGAWNREEGGYAHLHASKPATLGAALLDSPAGLAAWIGEKFMAWSSANAGPESGFPRELLLATLTLYWSTASIATSMLPYWAHAHDRSAILPIDDPSPVPTVVDVFGGERVPFPQPPRSLGERYFSVTGWRVHEHGGHFPAASAPRLLADALRQSFGVAPLG